MREIEFRGKVIGLEGVPGFVYGYYFADTTGGYLHPEHGAIEGRKCHFIMDEEMNNYEVDPKTVGQSTGLNDKNGKEIYKGDMVRLGALGGEVGEIVYNTSLCSYIVTNMYQWVDAYRLGDFCSLEIEIIGNIHDNPELLEVKS